MENMEDEQKVIFSELLKNLGDDYPGRKYEWVRCLLGDTLPISELSEHDMVLGLFNCLKTQGTISYSDVDILDEIASLTKTKSAIDHINSYRSDNNCTASGNKTLEKFREILFKALKETTKDDYKKLLAVYDLHDQKFDSIWDVVFYLETKTLLDKNQPKMIKRFAGVLNPKSKKMFEILLETPATHRQRGSHSKPIVPGVSWTSASTVLDEKTYRQLLIEMASWWSDYGDVFMLKVLLSDFDEISRRDIESKHSVFALFDLLRAAGLVSEENVDILIQGIALTVTSKIEGVDDKIRKRFNTFPGFCKIQINRFSYHRQNLIKFGHKLTPNDMDSIIWLKEINCPTDNPWKLIFELDINLNNAYTSEKTNGFVQDLKELDMHDLAIILEDDN